MATIVLSAAGMAIGGSVGGSVLGLSSAVIGRAVGASVGRALDQRLLGQGSDPVEVGRVDRFRLTGASEGAAIPKIYGRVRIGGQVIWASEFVENRTRRGGKGTAPRTTEYSYSVSVAIALCEGVVGGIGRIWADGEEIAPDDLGLRLYPGTETQEPDPAIEAALGVGMAPAYRGTAYVVIEDLDLGRFGNRVPQFTFEVHRPSQEGEAPASDLSAALQAVALMPGSGEYALATSTVALSAGYAQTRLANVNTVAGKTDIDVSLDQLERELPQAKSASLIVSWFGDDLRAGDCLLKPKVEQSEADGKEMPWKVSGIDRGEAEEVALDDEARPIYGGTPADASVIEAIATLKNRGIKPVFYPFILMEQQPGNGRTDPYTGASDQPDLPWRGRITTSLAPGQAGTTDGTSAAEAEVAAFFGTAGAQDFSADGDTVNYTGPAEYSYRRFILHYAHLCALAGGVDAFCIGSEMRGLTQIRGAGGTFPAVAAMRDLAADVRSILGPDTKIGYAADWSEYHGYQPTGTADKHFHLDPLWADDAIDFIGIDNYMPLSDWRDGDDHLDASWGRIHALDYLQSNVAGGELYDWYYASPEARDAQIRTPITDGDGEPWVWRLKDLVGWWENYHHDRVDGERAALPSAWVPGSKPIWFTELGCGAVDKGTNQPNKFLDPKSSESALPFYSNGLRDDLIQTQYLRAMTLHFGDSANNPVHPATGIQMVDMSRAHVWAWDARPWPAYPGLIDIWSDGANYARGHWITGRSGARPLASVVQDICASAGVTEIDTTDLYGLVRGYAVADVSTARAALQPLMTTYGFDVVEREGQLIFRSRDGISVAARNDADLAVSEEIEGAVERARVPDAEIAGRVRLNFVAADGAYDIAASEAALSDDPGNGVAQSDIPIVLTREEGQQIVERWLAESRLARDTARFALPPSQAALGAGDVITLDDGKRYRIDRLDQGLEAIADGVCVAPETYRPHEVDTVTQPLAPAATASPSEALFLDLPLLTGNEVAHAPHVALTADPWSGDVALYSAAQDSDYALNRLIGQPSVVGLTTTAMAPACPGLWDRGPALRVQLVQGELMSRAEFDVLGGANLAAIGDGSPGGWEVFQFSVADLVAPNTYDISVRLRGQLGTDQTRDTDWPTGSYFVLLDGSVTQIELAANARGVARHLRWGPASRPLGDPSYQYRIESFQGNGLRPYPVAHLRAATDEASGDIEVSWIRRTRIDGDSWDVVEVPLGEETESYVVRVLDGTSVVRETLVTAPNWTYGVAQQAADGIGATARIEVAQLSERFGPGPGRAIDLNP